MKLKTESTMQYALNLLEFTSKLRAPFSSTSDKEQPLYNGQAASPKSVLSSEVSL